jgi:rhodanese-related sulfurtransferase
LTVAKTLKGVDTQGAARLMQGGALMVDVREPHEYASQRIPGSRNVALSGLEQGEMPVEAGQAVVFFCASGARTSMHAARLAAKAGGADAYVMQGGIVAWGRSGLPIESGGAATGNGGRGPGLFGRLFGR